MDQHKEKSRGKQSISLKNADAYLCYHIFLKILDPSNHQMRLAYSCIGRVIFSQNANIVGVALTSLRISCRHVWMHQKQNQSLQNTNSKNQKLNFDKIRAFFDEVNIFQNAIICLSKFLN